jgi:CRP/FNR family transcriptional regulator, cyclic AMP receptor protein
MSVTIDMFRNTREFQTFGAGTVIFREGDPGDRMYVVLEGQIDLLVKGKRVDSLGPGGVFGEMAIIDATPRSATAIAARDTQLVPVSEKRFQVLVQQTPRFAIQIMRVLAERLRKMDRRI